MLLGVGLLVIPVWGLFHRPYDPDVPIPKEYHFQVDLNNASAIELQTLPGIGEKLAEGIVLHRQDEGPFRIPKDLTKVKGIGPKKLEAVTPHLLEIPEE